VGLFISRLTMLLMRLRLSSLAWLRVKVLGDMSVSYSDRASSYFSLAKALLELGARRQPPTPWISPQNIVRASEKDMPPANGTEFYTGQTDYLRP